jgi:competence protein ComEC
MQNRKIAYSLILILFIVSLILAGIIWHGKSQELKVIFLNVGQGDAILIAQGSTQILIDGGPSGQVLMEKLGKYVPFWDREIETVITTHPDQDHIEGLLEVMKNYKVDALIETTAQSESQLYKNYENLITEKQIQKIDAVAGVKIKLHQAEMEILSPRGIVPNAIVKDTNAYSVVAKLVFGKSSFLFTGDFPDTEEQKIIQEQVDLSALVLKVAHHGSKYATTSEFLDKVNPQEAIISVGQKNRFGHPTAETLNRLQERNINIFRTDERGDIEYACANFDSDCVMFAN